MVCFLFGERYGDIHANMRFKDLRELPKNNLRILLALLPDLYVVITGT